MYTGQSYQFLTAVEQQAFHKGLKAEHSSQNPHSNSDASHVARAWAKGNQLAFRLNARLGVQYLNASNIRRA
jgi:hypothetical protein